AAQRGGAAGGGGPRTSAGRGPPGTQGPRPATQPPAPLLSGQSKPVATPPAVPSEPLRRGRHGPPPARGAASGARAGASPTRGEHDPRSEPERPVRGPRSRGPTHEFVR